MKIQNRRKGFTLIELLVVVLILSILMAIALPLYLSAVADSERKTCRANLQTIANTVQARRVQLRSADYAFANGAVTVANLPDLGASIPICPTAGAYTIAGAATYSVSCADHGSFTPGTDAE